MIDTRGGMRGGYNINMMKTLFLPSLKRAVKFCLWGGKIQPLWLIDKFYQKSDPWNYQTTPDDRERKAKILAALANHKFNRALDIGCGEGWITQDLPAAAIMGIDVASAAVRRAVLSGARGDYRVCNVNRDPLPDGEFDLLVATCSLYDWYVLPEAIPKIIAKLSQGGWLVSCHIQGWPVAHIDLPVVYREEFPYRRFRQELVIYEKSL